MRSIVSIAHVDGNIWIKVIGCGNFQCSPCLRKIVQEQLAQGHYDYIVDLTECNQLDSTFMGTLAGIAQRLRNKKKGSFQVVNVSESNQQLMENLGLDQIFSISPIAEGKKLPLADAECSFVQVTEGLTISKESVEEIVRSAHQALVRANQANAPKFQSLLEII
jgi:anti-anti-sigma factor